MQAVHVLPMSLTFKKLSWFDWIYAALLWGGALYAFNQYGQYMDVFEKTFLFGFAGVFSWMGWTWKQLRALLLTVIFASLFGIIDYHAELSRAQSAFFLKFMLASQSAIMWMSSLFVMATLTYWLALAMRSTFAAQVASGLTWSAVAMGLIGLLVRWYESYLISPDVGHIPISNLYEVFILFSIITALLYLYYEQRYNNKMLGAFVLPVITAAVAFLLWYALDRHEQNILPLVPALQSYWMKLHVPANFIGYGSFSLAAMVAVAWLLADRGILASRLPTLNLLDDLMYKSIAVGFGFFTIATILGALWASEAWGGYWSWDPKETWALIVWLNYAAWLHIRQVKGLRGTFLAWWAVIGLFVTVFAFLGVNMFLSGLHSYGKL